MILDDDAKAAKQRHVEGHTGSSLWEIQHVLLVCMTAYLFWRAVSLRLAPSLSTLPACLLEFAVLVVPFIVAITFTQWTNTVLVAQTAGAALLLALSRGSSSARRRSKSGPKPPAKAPRAASDPAPRAFAPFSVAFRAYLQLLTVAAILAVDFNVFPRRFAKAETFGTSLMDLGVGAFVFSSGLVSGPRLSSRSQTSSTKLSKTLMIVLPPMIFGLLRTLLTKSVNYQEHVTEYGVHWNFFFTLGIISLLVTLQGIFIPRASFAIVGLTVLLGYQMALARGLQEYILTAPRVDFFSMNREGICSLAGYYCILQFAAQIGAKVLPSEPTADIGRRRFETLGTSFVMLVFGFVVSNQVYGIQVSRRMANAPYAFWVTAVCVFFVSSFFAIDEALSRMFHADAEVLRRLSAPPVLFDQINRSHLVTFLVANLLTGLVNLTIDTLRVPDLAAFGIVCGYVFTVCMAIATVIRAPVVDSQEFSHLVSGTSLVSSYSSPARGMTTRTAGSRRTSIAGDAASVYASNNNAMNFGASSGSDENTALRAPAKIADDLSINRSAAFFNHKQRLREKDKARPDASACVAVVGAPGSGKRGVIEIECGSVNEDAMVRTHHDDSLSIKITSKMYVAGNQNIRIEYWDAPEREDMLRFTARYVAGLTATLFVFDVNDDMSLDNLVPWIEEIGTHAYSQNSQSPFGLCKFLIGNKTNTPGKRAILEVDAKAFAHREFDDNERIHEIFQALVDNLQRTMPRELSPRPTVNKPTDQPKLTPYAPPIGMQIGIAMDPALKVMYRLRLRETQPNRNAATTVVDWLKVASTNNFTKYSKAIYG